MTGTKLKIEMLRYRTFTYVQLSFSNLVYVAVWIGPCFVHNWNV